MAIHLSHHDEIALITLDRPEALNALSFGQLHDLNRILDSIADSPARALLVTGAGDRAFSAGADIKELMGRSLVEQRAGALLGQSVLAKLDQLSMPSVALINGYAFGGGLELALACTFRLALPTAKLGFPEIKLGLIPGYGGTQRLPRLVGESRAIEMILTGRTLEADEAARIGLVNRLVEGDLIETGIAFAREIDPRISDRGLDRRHDRLYRKAQTGLQGWLTPADPTRALRALPSPASGGGFLHRALDLTPSPASGGASGWGLLDDTGLCPARCAAGLVARGAAIARQRHGIGTRRDRTARRSHRPRQ